MRLPSTRPAREYTARAALAGAALFLLGGTALADAKSDALFQKAREALAAARGLEAEATYMLAPVGRSGELAATIRLLRPNLGQFVVRPKGEASLAFAIYSDGKTLYRVRPLTKQYQRIPAPPKGMGDSSRIYLPLQAFYEPEILTAGADHEYLGARTVDGKSYEVVQGPAKAPLAGTARYFFGESGLLEGMEIDLKQEPPGTKMTFWLKNVNLTPSLTEKEFAYTPPADYTLHDPLAALEGSLLKVGTNAPDFRLPQPDGSPLTLSGMRKGKKAVLINFWFYG